VEGQNHGLSYSYSCCSCYSWEMVEMVEMVGRKPPARFSVWITFFFSSQISQISHIDDTGATQKSGTTAGGQQRLRGKLAGHRGPFLGVTMCDTRMGSLPQIHSNRHSIWRYYEGIWGHILYINIYIFTPLPWYTHVTHVTLGKNPFLFLYSDSSLIHICYITGRVAICHIIPFRPWRIFTRKLLRWCGRMRPHRSKLNDLWLKKIPWLSPRKKGCMRQLKKRG
jgi:hypothetical protein